MTTTTLPQKKPTPSRSSRSGETGRSLLTFTGIVIVLVIFWEGVKFVFNIPQYNLPHIWEIVGALFNPVREGGPALGIILTNAALYTVGEAFLGFTIGSIFGFTLAVIFAQSNLLQRGLMPFVVASQTVPILAVAPMVVIGLSSLNAPRWLSVSIIAAYLSFFPVTLNTLRGLTSVPNTALELMKSYALSSWRIMLVLRIPNALPYVFTALKVSATASIVGAIIGELPSSIQDGLGGAILNFNQYYNSAPPNLWATILVAAAVGIIAYSGVAIAERIVLRWLPPDRASA
jgi:NitT/TauT family transport system permease protein